jgi:hypothetical protein
MILAIFDRFPFSMTLYAVATRLTLGLNLFNDGANVVDRRVIADGRATVVWGVFLGASIGTDRARNMTQCLIEKAARGEVKVAIEPARYPSSLRPHPYIESRLAVGRFS